MENTMMKKEETRGKKREIKGEKRGRNKRINRWEKGENWENQWKKGKTTEKQGRKKEEKGAVYTNA